MSRRRGFETIRDMSLSVGLVAAVVLVVFGFVAWQRPEVQGPVRPEVDVAQVFADVRVGEPFAVLEPVGLSAGWDATSAWFEPASVSTVVDGGVLHVGYLTPADSYAEVRQTDGDTGAAVAEWIGADPDVVDEVVIKGDRWQLVESVERGREGLVHTRQGTTVVVTGKAGRAELEELAASLQ